MRSSENERLLRETLRNEDYEKFRHETFAAGLRVLRQKRRHPFGWPTLTLALAAAVVLLLSLISWFPQKEDSVVKEETTVKLPHFEIVRSLRDPSLEVSTKPSDLVEVIETRSSPLRQINDQELLSLFAHRPVAFLRQGQTKEFIVLGN